MISEVVRKGLLIPSERGRPSMLVFSAWLEHAAFANWLIDAHRPACLVELGTYTGFSYLTFLEALERSQVTASCFAIDTWEGDDHAGFYDEHAYSRLKAFHDPRYGRFSQLLRATFDEAVGRFADGWIDLLHIDGRHGYEDVRHDFETWRPKLSPRAVVLFHDTMAKGEGFGVHRFWKEVRQGLPSFEFVHGHGLGVLGVGPKQTPRMTALFEAGRNARQREEIRDHYAALGAEVDKRYRDSMAEERPLPWHK